MWTDTRGYVHESADVSYILMIALQPTKQAKVRPYVDLIFMCPQFVVYETDYR